jgi:hypothetical protein
LASNEPAVDSGEHKALVSEVRKEFELASRDDKVMIVTMDFAADVEGYRRHETIAQFHQNPRWSPFNITTYNARIGFRYYDYIGESTVHKTAAYTAAAFTCFCRDSMSVPEQVEQVWSDGGSTIKNNIVLATVFDEQARTGLACSVRFFASYHGKNQCDRHFGVVSRLNPHFGRDLLCIGDLLELANSKIENSAAFVIAEDLPNRQVDGRVAGIRSMHSFTRLTPEKMLAKRRPTDVGMELEVRRLI